MKLANKIAITLALFAIIGASLLMYNSAPQPTTISKTLLPSFASKSHGK